ncbi:MAG: TolC family protein [Deltaproteobacteria bacterium]|nr:TolC family protein [Deltaproteobacteria bacterium]
MNPGRQFIGMVMVFFFCFMGVPLPGLAEEKGVYTLEKSIEEAFSNNWSLKAKAEKITQAEQVKKQARAEFFPKLSTSYGYTRLSETPTTQFSLPPLVPPTEIAVGAKDNYQWKGTITQPLFTGFALRSSYDLAKLGIDQSLLEVALEKMDLALRVKEAYFGILKADKALDVAQKAVAALESHVKMAQNFYDVGMIPVNELLKAEVELSNSRHDLVRAQSASRLARASFNTVLSRPIEAPVEVEDILVYKGVGCALQEYLPKALKNRPEIKAIDLAIAQADQQIRLTKSKNYPEIAFTYDYIKEGDDMGVSGDAYHDANRWEAGVGLTWTFWEWGKTHYAVKEKQSLKKQLLHEKKALEDRILLEVKNALLDLEVARKDIPTTKKAVEQAEENLRVSEERYKVQATTSTEVLDAQTLLTQARSNYYDALYNHNLAKARLKRAIGEY